MYNKKDVVCLVATDIIRVSVDLKSFLDKNKRVPAESFDSVIRRLIKFKSGCKKQAVEK